MKPFSEMTNEELDHHIAELGGWVRVGNFPEWVKGNVATMKLPSPTTDPRYAMELLEEIVKDGIHSYTLYCDGGAYYSFEIRVAGDKSTAFAEGNDKLRVINEAYAQWKGAE